MEAPSAPAPVRLRRWRVVALAIVATAAGCALGYAVKAPCTNPVHAAAGWKLTHDCYSDIQELYGVRRTQFHTQSGYVPFAEHGLAYRNNEFEYPAFTGLFVDAVNSFVPQWSYRGFLAANALGLSVFAIAGAVALALVSRKPWRLLLYALTPEVFAYAFHNWDLLPVAFGALALWAFTRRRDGVAGLMLGLGAAAKVYPGLFLPVLLIARIRNDEPAAPLLSRAALERTLPLILGTIAGFLVPNLIVLGYAGVHGWAFPWQMQSLRTPNSETFWFVLFRVVKRDRFAFPTLFYGRIAQLGSLALLAGGSVALIRAELRRPRFRPAATCFGVVLVYLLTAKVLSPQYALWVLPFLVVVRVPWYGVAVFVITDMAELSAVWLLNTVHGYRVAHYVNLLDAAVFARYAAYLLLLWLSRRASDDSAPELDPGRDPEGAIAVPA